MQVTMEKAVLAFRKVQYIQEHWRSYCLAPDRVKVSVEDFHRVIEDMYGLKITKYSVSFEGEHLRGMVERYSDGTARIYVRHQLPGPLKRFTAAKELCHLALDEEEDWSTQGVSTIDGVILDFGFLENGLPYNAAQSEVLAWAAAIEILYPIEYRRFDRAALTQKETTATKLALQYDLPVSVVFRALHEDHMAHCENVWKLVRR